VIPQVGHSGTFITFLCSPVPKCFNGVDIRYQSLLSKIDFVEKFSRRKFLVLDHVDFRLKRSVPSIFNFFSLLFIAAFLIVIFSKFSNKKFKLIYEIYFLEICKKLSVTCHKYSATSSFVGSAALFHIIYLKKSYFENL